MRYPLIIGIAVALCGCATVERDWQETNRQATVESYEHFLQKHPDADQASQARLLLTELQAGEAWSEASSADTIAGYTDFLQEYPQYKHANQASARLEQLEEERDWAQTKSSGTVVAYQEFLQNHPESKEAAGARQELEQLEEERDWAQTRSSGTVAAYQGFLQKHPESREAAGARQELEQLEEDRDWKSTQEANSAGAYQEFLKNYATSKYATEAQKRLMALQAAAESRMTAQTRAGEADLSYELIALTKAVKTGRISGLVAKNLGIGQNVHRDTMRELIDDIEARHKAPGTKDSLRETLGVLLREVKEIRNVATHQLLVFDRDSGNIAVISKAYTDLLEKGVRGYGVVLPSLCWGYMPPFAREASRLDWQRAKATRVNAGRWAGAYLLNGKQVLLPGFRALDKLSGSASPDGVPVMDAMTVKRNSHLIANVLWGKKYQDGDIFLFAIFGIENRSLSDIEWDTIGYKVIPDWNPGDEIPLKNYAKEVNMVGGQSQGEVHTLEANSVNPIGIIVIPQSNTAIKPYWDRSQLGAMVVMSHRGEPVYVGVTRLPQTDEVSSGRVNVIDAMKSIVLLQTYVP